MSCRMTENRELAIMAKYIAQTINMTHTSGYVEGVKAFYSGDDLVEAFADCKAEYGYCDPRLVYRALFDMNAAAYKARYDEDAAKWFEPMPSVMIDISEDGRKDWQVRLWSILKFYVYQCAEGDVYGSRRFNAVSEFKRKIAERIAGDAADAKGLKWGEF